MVQAALGQGVGYGIVLGLGILFAIGMVSLFFLKAFDPYTCTKF
jgi:hypothetical protein